MTIRRAVASLALASLALAACTAPPPDGERPPTPSPSPSAETARIAELRLPAEATTVLDAPDAAVRAVATSAALYAGAPVVVVAPAADVAAQLDAAALAVSLGAPLLLSDATSQPEDVGDDDASAAATTPPAEPSGPETTDTAATAAAAGEAAAAEVERLGAVAVLTVGGAAVEVDDDVTVVPAPAGPQARARALRVAPLATPAAAPGTEVAAVAALTAAPADAAGEQPGGTTAPGGTPTEASETSEAAEASEHAAGPEPSASPDPPGSSPTEPSPDESSDEPDDDAPRLPLTVRAAAPSGGLVLTTGDVADLAAVATARAAGVPVLVVPGGDPRAGSATVRAVADAAPTAVVALGAAFGAPADLGWKVATAATGVELPGGGQTLFPGRRLVALYGTPTFPVLGVLGEQDLPASVERVRGMAAAYQALTTDTVVPAFEIIVTIASAGAGDDGNYSNELPVETFVPWVEAARDAGVYVVLDLQPGRTDFVTQARRYEPLLLYPNVGLALDPEWRLAPDQVHLRQIGSVHASEVNAVSAYLADLTRAHALPQKLFVLHQFSHRMIADRHLVDTSRPELATMIHVDGQGSQGAKAGTWASLQQGAPPGIAWGWKNFVDEDVPMLTPPETYAVQPVPQLVTYQ